jgi:hypothetical protein
MIGQIATRHESKSVQISFLAPLVFRILYKLCDSWSITSVRLNVHFLFRNMQSIFLLLLWNCDSLTKIYR